MALADAGDGMEDSNFEFATANRAIMKLTQQEHNFQEYVDGIKNGTVRNGDDSTLTFSVRIIWNAVVHHVVLPDCCDETKMLHLLSAAMRSNLFFSSS